MEKLEIRGSQGKSTLLVGESLLNLEKYLPCENRKIAIITDSNVKKFYGKNFPSAHIIEIGQGESVKNLDTVCKIYEKLVEMEADRSWFLVGIGGGIVCDIAGFVASTYMRGLGFGFVPTTLLAQVDASVGGKNGVNFKGYKNMVGVFNQPQFVICDPDLLETLPQKELQCGFAEIVKHGAIADSLLFDFLYENYKKALALDKDVIKRLVKDSIIIKAGVVNRDEKEKGERKKLNFGHTLGHAIEKISGVSHGQAISIGMVAASNLSVKKGLLNEDEAATIKSLLKNLGLPVRFDFDPQKALEAMKHDKKREGELIHFVLLKKIGEALIREITIKEIEEIIHEWH